jgi:hypothetical protein
MSNRDQGMDDWLCDHEFEKMREFLEKKGLDKEFDLWVSCEYSQGG